MTRNAGSFETAGKTATAGAAPYARDNPRGHFALETHGPEIAALMRTSSAVRSRGERGKAQL